MTNSMSPSQMIDRYAARDEWDEEPWRHPYSVESRAPFDVHGHWIFAPRESRIPAPDPKPFVDPSMYGRFTECLPYISKFRPRPWSVLRAAGVTREPRQCNPILSRVREAVEEHGQTLEQSVAVTLRRMPTVERWAVNGEGFYTPTQVAEARVVLSRLQSVIEASP